MEKNTRKKKKSKKWEKKENTSNEQVPSFTQFHDPIHSLYSVIVILTFLIRGNDTDPFCQGTRCLCQVSCLRFGYNIFRVGRRQLNSYLHLEINELDSNQSLKIHNKRLQKKKKRK